MLIVLIFRLAFSKTNKDPYHQLTSGYIWYDKNSGSGQSFLGYTIFDTSTNWLQYCKNRSYGPDRTVIALAPSGDSIISSIKTTIEADFGSKGYTVKLYSSRDAIMNVVSSSTYEKDGNSGI